MPRAPARQGRGDAAKEKLWNQLYTLGMDMNKPATEGIQETIQMPEDGHQAPLEIHPQSTVIKRRGWEMVEEVVPAFVKISTAFKSELKEIDGSALKIWIYLALSINRNTEEAHPGVRTIAAACDLAQNTVTAAIMKLEGRGLLTVNRADKKYNIYRIPDFVSANSKSASKNEAVQQTASISGQTASIPGQTASIALRLNQINQREPELINAQQKHKFIPTGSPEEKKALHLFTDCLGLFHGEKDVKRWLAIVDVVGMEQAEAIITWAEKREIHLANRPGLLDSLETAAKNWNETKQLPRGPKYPGRQKGNAQPDRTPEDFAKALEAAKGLMPCHQA